LAVFPGDSISASVTYGSSGFDLYIEDNTTGQSYSITRSATAQQSSAEWIVEAPSSGSGILPLANFGTVNFSGAQATINGTEGPIDDTAWESSVNSIDMASSSGTPLDETLELTDANGASSFGVTYTGGSGEGGGGGGGGRHHHGPNDAAVFIVPGQPDFQALSSPIPSSTGESPAASGKQEPILPAPAADAFFAQMNGRLSSSDLKTGWGALHSGITDEASAWGKDGFSSLIPGEELRPAFLE
jgi:Peptidase A4 family